MAEIHPLKTYRKSHEPALSQAELARTLGVSRLTVTRWETGERKIGVKKLPKVSETTGISKRDLRPDMAEWMQEAAQ